MNKSRLYNIFLLSCVILILTGCRGGGSSSGGSGEGVRLLRSSSGDVLGIIDTGSDSSGSGIGSGSGGVGGSLPSTPAAPVVNPEPSSFILLTSGLIGMAVYAKARLKNKGKE